MSSGEPTPGSSSSSPIATGTTTTTGSSSSTFSPPPASTFPPDPTPSPTFGPPNNNNNNPTPGIATSASLYLYTFLATLVLLLGVSSAIVVRSLILRRRHRRMIEEAIRNGTWVPPAAASSRRVDLSKKPKMYEAWISHGNIQDNRAVEHPDWEGIMPFSVLYTLSNKPAAGTPQASTSINNNSTNHITPPTSNADARTGAPARSRLSRFSPLSLFRRPVAPAASPSGASPASPAGDAANNAAGVGNAAGNSGSSGSHGNEKQPVAQVDGRKSKVQVAVLIAMPNASHSSYYNTPSPQSIPPLPISDASSTGSTQAPLQILDPLLSTPLAATPTSSSSLPNSSTHHDDEEEELPPIEVGVAQVSILGEDDDEETIDRTSSEARGAKRSIGSVSDHHQDSGSRSSDGV
ncbi:hypothetical protein PLEOSDRAFT_1108139 [Pleurotus ostreatus PC15]|uniref:Uncharacterized protein n=1 Tax=Pleurotus ostreatus (strain PC15) TaxID=1137138 RepID=A0A067NHR1_PLEO1|nr:hypothetical protein PLEOSDRAFT_1108139 [Pleurotus ostreatus PC15]